mgnify:CR=1 FL=1
MGKRDRYIEIEQIKGKKKKDKGWHEKKHRKEYGYRPSNMQDTESGAGGTA